MWLFIERAVRIASQLGQLDCGALARHRLRRCLLCGVSTAIGSAVLLFAIPSSLTGLDARAAAQDTSEATVEETVANLAAGRVVIAVVKDAIIVGTVENPIEVETRPPIPVPLAGDRFGIVLGAVDWSYPSSHEVFAKLDQELPHLRGRLIADVPHLQSAQGGTEASDIEAIGQGVLERLNQLAQNLHGQVDLPDDEPLAQVILAGYLTGYGPEVWQLSYTIKQQEEQNGYWTTRVLRPSYIQAYPPEKKQPRNLVEFQYPPSDASTLLDLLRQNDPRLSSISSSDPAMAAVATKFLAGETDKVPAADATQFLRAALNAVSPPNARQVMASLTEDTGLAWILPPPPEPSRPGLQKPRPAGAPSLLKQQE
jgi:hypothetical protein